MIIKIFIPLVVLLLKSAVFLKCTNLLQPKLRPVVSSIETIMMDFYASEIVSNLLKRLNQ